MSAVAAASPLRRPQSPGAHFHDLAGCTPTALVDARLLPDGRHRPLIVAPARAVTFVQATGTRAPYR